MLCISRSSAVGSALRSGRRGRAFESPLLVTNQAFIIWWMPDLRIE